MNLFKGRVQQTLEFPEKYSLGRLYVPGADGYTFLSEARGPVQIIPGTYLFLKVYPQLTKLNALSSLSKDDLYALSMAHSCMSDEDFKPLSRLTGLKALHCEHTRLSGRFLKNLCPLNLNFLSVRRSPFSDQGISNLQNMQTLEILDLSVTNVSSQCSLHLSKLPALKNLFLCENRMSDHAAEHIGRIKSLERLHLSGTRFGDQGVNTLGGLDKLKSLRLERTYITDDCISSICRLPQLSELGLSNNKISNQGLKALSGQAQLKRLELAQTHLTDDGLQWLAQLPSLEELDLTGTDISDKSAAIFSSMHSLKQVILTGTRISASGRALIEKLAPNLNVVHVPPMEGEYPLFLLGMPFSLQSKEASVAITGPSP